MIALKHIYSIGRVIAATSLLVGVLAQYFGGPLGLGASAQTVSGTGLTVGLLALGLTPIVGLALEGGGYLRRRMTDAVGWLALALSVALSVLWWLG